MNDFLAVFCFTQDMNSPQNKNLQEKINLKSAHGPEKLLAAAACWWKLSLTEAICGTESFSFTSGMMEC